MQRSVYASLLLVVLTACGGGAGAGGGSGSPIPVPSASPTNSPAPSSNVRVPSTAYLGASDDAAQTPATREQQLESLEAQAGKHFALQMTYGAWAGITSSWIAANAEMQGDITYNRIPNLSWTCGDDLDNIAHAASGSTGQLLTDYQVIKSTADALKAYGHPVLLRFFHEFNLNVNGATTNGDAANCFNQADTLDVKAQKFVAAWENIYAIFQQEGVTNVSFEWCPTDLDGYGPVPNYAALIKFLPTHVDWIGVDRYDKPSVGFKALFTNYYNYFSAYAKPMIISETGEIPSGNPSGLPNWNPAWSQAQFFSDIQADLPTLFPGIKAINYFNSRGADIWYLDSGGTSGVISALRNPYFVSP